MRDKWLFILFGLESGLWDSIGDAERRRFRMLLLFFGINSLLLLTGSIITMYLVRSAWSWALGGGFLLTFVFWNILRFSYLSIRISPSEFNQQIQRTLPGAEAGAAQPVVPHQKLFAALTHRSKAALHAVLALLGFGRWLLFLFTGLIVLALAFPYSYLLVYRKANTLNTELIARHLSRWEQSERADFKRSLQTDTDRLKELQTKCENVRRNGFTPDDAYFQEILVEITAQEELIRQKEQHFEDSFRQRYNSFRLRWEKRYFVIHLIELVIRQPGSLLVLFLLSFLFFAPLFLLFYLKTGRSFQYFTESARCFHEHISAEYHINQKEIQQVLKLKYGSLKPVLRDSIWADEPYNTRYLTPYVPKTEVPLSALKG